jgi:hypothetical protein
MNFPLDLKVDRHSTQSRRHILSLLPLSFLVACANGLGSKPKEPIAKAAPFVKKEVVWNTSNYLDFLAALPPSGLLVLKKSLELLPGDATEAMLSGTQVDVLEISTALCRKASWFGVCRNPSNFDYHLMVVGIAMRTDVAPKGIERATTFDAEHLVMEKVISEVEKDFLAKWSKMSIEDRKKVLQKADQNGRLLNHAAIAAETGSLAIRSLSAVVGLAGFSAYVTATTA